jgi:hypothetical protein
VLNFVSFRGKTAAETVTKLKEAFKDNAIGITPVYKCFKHFKNGEMPDEDQPRCGYPSTSSNDKNVEQVLQGYPCRSLSDQ